MSQLGEGVLAALTHDSEHAEDTCAFCSAPPEPSDECNDFTDKHDEDVAEIAGLESDGIAFKNCADKLGQALTRIGLTQISTTVAVPASATKPAAILPLFSAAHHLIPGNAALKQSELKPHLHTEGMATGNIGYDVNNFDNGVWLPGNYALRGKEGLPRWGPGGINFSVDTGGLPPSAYAFAAIEKTGRQFHDAHGDYSDFVLNELNLLAQKLECTQDLWCPEAKKKEAVPPEKRQLFVLVARLNTVSRRLKGFVCNAGPKWRENLVTSRFSLDYIRQRLQK